MRASPAFQCVLNRFGVWRAAVAVVASAGIVVLLVWLATTATAARQTPKRFSTHWKAGDARIRTAWKADRADRRDRQTRLKTSVPLVPPKPKLFFTAYSIFISRAVFAQ